MPVNAFEAEARLKKIDALVATFEQAGVNHDFLEQMDEAAWKVAADYAKVNMPSLTTRQMVIASMRRRAGVK